MSDVNILFIGQSNAYNIINTFNLMPELQNEVAYYLGLDPSQVNIIDQFTSVPGTPLQPDPSDPQLDSWLNYANGINTANGWTNSIIEQDFLQALGDNQGYNNPTLVDWLWNESDASNPDITTAAEISAIEYQTAQIKSYYPNTSVEFIDGLPYDGATDAGMNAVKNAFEILATQPGYGIAAHINDVNMDYNGVDGGPHMSLADAEELISRVAKSDAVALAGYANPGSMAALGLIDSTGPTVNFVDQVNNNQIFIGLNFDNANNLIALDDVAASGLGWNITQADGSVLSATNVQILNNNLLITFNGNIQNNSTVFYAAGNTRLAQGLFYPGENNGIYDNQDMPLSLPNTGVAINTNFNLINATSGSNIAAITNELVTADGPITFFNQSFDSTLFTQGGTFAGGSGSIDVYNTAGDFVAFGGSAGNNILNASGAGNAVLVGGGNGDDLILSGSGPGQIWAGNDTETLDASQSTGATQIIANGNDAVFLGATSTVWAGSAPDIFTVINNIAQNDLIINFKSSDLINMQNYDPVTVANILNNAVDFSTGTLLTLPNHGELVVFGVPVTARNLF